MWLSNLGRQKKSKANRTKSCDRKYSLERLEERMVFSADFMSAMNVGGDTSDGIFDMTSDSAGNTYVTGFFSGMADFDKAGTHAGDSDLLTARGSTDAFVAKYAPDNSLLWVRRMGGDHDGGSGVSDTGREIVLDAAGNVIVTGEFQQVADFGSTALTSAGSADAFVAKFDAAGNWKSAWRWGSTEFEAGFGLGVDSSGNAYVAVQKGDNDSVVKFKSNGAVAWSASVAGTLYGQPDLAVSSSGNVYMVGTFKGTVDFDPSAKRKLVSSGASFSAFTLKLDTNGKFGWVTPFAGRSSGSQWGSSIATAVTLDQYSNLYVAGHYTNNLVDFNPASATTSLDASGGAYVAKLSSAGALTWAKSLSGSQSNIYGLDVDAAGNVYAAGSFSSPIDLNPGTATETRTPSGGYDIFVVKLSSTGNYVWGETFGGAGTDVAFSVDVTSSGKVRLAGYFEDEVDFDPDPFAQHMLGASGAARDAFFLELGQS